jgi:tetraacyldisaccharide 4'-kinase
MKNLLFIPISKIFEAVSKTRIYLYRRRILNRKSLIGRTISVGNITVGGTGKTPLVAFIAKILAKKGEKVCILTRGYGRENSKQRVLVSDGKTIFANTKQSGDEPFELAEKLHGIAAVIADKRRYEAGKWAVENLGSTAFILDDGFQHIQLNRNLDIVCIDASNPFGNGKLLPAGVLREPVEALERADAIVITRANLIHLSEFTHESLTAEIMKYTDSPIFVSRNKIDDSEVDKSQKCFAFCGLGNPENFFEQLEQDGFEVNGKKAFLDHHKYSKKDIDLIENLAAEVDAKLLLTTAKDAVKLSIFEFFLPIKIVESKITFDDEKAFSDLISN